MKQGMNNINHYFRNIYLTSCFLYGDNFHKNFSGFDNTTALLYCSQRGALNQMMVLAVV